MKQHKHLSNNSITQLSKKNCNDSSLNNSRKHNSKILLGAMNISARFLLLPLFFILASKVSKSQNVVTYTAPSTTASSVATNCTVSSLSNNLGSGSGCPNSYAGSNVDQPSASNALSSGNYLEFTVTPNCGYQLNINSVTAYALRRGAQSPSATWAYSTNGGSNWTYSSSTSISNGCGTTTTNAVLSFGTPLTSTNAVIFRLLLWGAASSSTTVSIGNLMVTGSLSSVSMPATSLSLSGVSSTATTNASIGTLTATAKNACGNTNSSYTNNVQIVMVSGPGSITGTSSVNAVAGISSFNNLQFSQAGTYTIKATDGTLNSSTSSNIVVSDAVTLSSFTPASGYVGTTITITGTGFKDGANNNTITAVQINGVNAASFTTVSSTQITAVVSSSNSSGQITLVKSGGNVTSSNAFSMQGYISAQTGTWATTSTWQGGAVPPSSSKVTIAAGHTVTYNSSSSSTLTLNQLTINGTLKNTRATAYSISNGITVNGVYEHALDGNIIPTATWNSGSTCLISGILSNGPSNGLGQNFDNFTWNCSAQSANVGLAGALKTINGTFSVSSTGSGKQLRLSSTTNYKLTIGNNLNLTGGTLLLNSSSSKDTLILTKNCIINGGNLIFNNALTGQVMLNISGDFTHTSGTISNDGLGTATINFVNPTTIQAITQSIAASSLFFAATPATINIGNASLSAQVQFQSDIDLNTANLNAYNNSTVNFQQFALSGSGNFTAYNSVNLITKNPTVFGGALGQINYTIPTTSDIILDGAAIQQISTINATNTCNSITINNPLGVSNSINVTTGTLTINNSNLTNNGNLICNNIVLNNGSINSSNNIETNNITFNGGIISLSYTSEIYVKSSSATAISGYSTIHSLASSNYVIGKLRRKVATGTYDFPVGTSGNYEIAQININSNSNVDNILLEYLTWGGSNLNYNSNMPNFGVKPQGANQYTAINGMLDYGYYEVTPYDASKVLVSSPTINYDATMTFNGHSNAILGSSSSYSYSLIKAPHTLGASGVVNWGIGNGTMTLASQLVGGASNWSTITGKLSNLTSFSVFAMGFNNSSFVLPLDLLSFDVSKQTSSVNINWSIANERNSNGYIIERSNNGTDFSEIGSINNIENSNIVKSYSFVDENPLPGINYYRLKIELNGSADYSKIKYVDFNLINDADFNAFIFENATESILSMKAPNNGEFTVSVYSSNGELLAQNNNMHLDANVENKMPLPLNGLPNGMYLVAVQGNSIKPRSYKTVKRR